MELSREVSLASAWRAFADDVITEACIFEFQKSSLASFNTGGVHNRQICTQTISTAQQPSKA